VDEPTASLDSERGKKVMGMLKKIAQEKQTAVITESGRRRRDAPTSGRWSYRRAPPGNPGGAVHDALSLGDFCRKKQGRPAASPGKQATGKEAL